ncbi:hypothetical protein, partial [Ochrobactrum sp. 3-3]|uniref:hypothetical protein n=1 Tax=Ochrobactrum sp. 3-3 TaxID=1830124 RepID=UPI0019641899
TVALHSLVLSMGQSLLQNGLSQRGKVIENQNNAEYQSLPIGWSQQIWRRMLTNLCHGPEPYNCGHG